MCLFEIQLDNTPLSSSHNSSNAMMPSSSLPEHDASSVVSTSSSESRSVRFHEQLTVIQAQEETPSSLWYQLEDLEVFRTEARELCKQIRSSQTAASITKTGKTSSVAPVTSSSDLELQRDWNSRGLELRSCLERQRRKFLANRYIVKASRKFDPNKLASFSTRCTQWAASLAQQEGQRDFERAYPSDEADVEAPSPSLKRQVSDEAETETRQVRPRLLESSCT